MGDKINQYLLERLTFGDEDYYDIDYFDGLVYQTAKIKGSTIKAGIISAIVENNIYTNNGILQSDRNFGGDFFTLFLYEMGQFRVESSAVGIDNIVFEVNDNATNFGIVIRDSDSGLRVLATKDGKVEISGAYFLPDADGLLNEVMTTDGAGNLFWNPVPSATNIYSIDGTIGSGRDVQITDTLDLRGGQIIRRANGGNFIREVTDPSHLPAVLIGNTTYVIIGTIDVSTTITVNVEGCAIIGRDRNKDCINWIGPANNFLFDVIDVDFELSNIKITSGVADNAILQANNYNAGDYNEGRTKTLSITNCQFRGCYDLMDIIGYDLVDISQCLIWYCKAQNFGMQFQSTSKIEFSSCEIIRWFDESSVIPPLVTPAGFAQVPMIDIRANGIQAGIGAVNISGNIFHPQDQQDAILISNTSTTGFGTIASNTFIDIGITTGILANFDYNIQNTYIIQANQGISNGNALATMNLKDNAEFLDIATVPTNPIVFKGSNCIGGTFTNPITFPISNRVITNIADCSLTYNSKITANFFVAVSAFVERGGDGFIEIRLRRNGVAITTTTGRTEIRQSRAESISFTIIGQATFGDVFDLEVECQNTSGVIQNANVLVRDLTLNGYQF